MRRLSTIAGIVLVAIGLLALTSNSWAMTGEKNKEFEKKWTLSTGELRELRLQSEYPVDLKFEKSRDGTNSVYLKGHGKQQMIDAVSGTSVSGGKLDLQLSDTRKWHFSLFRFGSYRDKQEMIVTLTDGAALETLGLKLDSGSLTLSDVQVKLADLSIDSGSVTINNLIADRLKVQADSGSINADGIKADSEIHADSGAIRLEHVTGPIVVSADSGSIKLYKDDTSATEIKADAGSVYVHVPASFAGIYDLQSDVGSIHAPESKRQTADVVKVRSDAGSITVEQD